MHHNISDTFANPIHATIHRMVFFLSCTVPDTRTVSARVPVDHLLVVPAFTINIYDKF